MPRPFRIEAIARSRAILNAPLALASKRFLDDLRHHFSEIGVTAAVAAHDDGPIFDWIARLLPLQGISNAAAYGFAAKHLPVRKIGLDAALASPVASCPKLASFWNFEGCGHRIEADTCSEPRHRHRCPVAALPMRNGRIAQAVMSLRLFVRDVADDDLVGWIDARLAAADPGPGHPGRARALRKAILEPLANVHGVSNKVASMIMADLLLASDPGRERWVTTGASMIVVDSLVHNFLHRTGALAAFDCRHPYGDACYAPGGCSDVIESIASSIDAREFNRAFPATFSRWVQRAIWSFCSADGWDICNGNQVDDRGPCEVAFCPTSGCGRMALGDRRPLPTTSQRNMPP